MSLTCPYCTRTVLQYVRDSLADEEAIFVSSEIIDWIDEQINLHRKSLVTNVSHAAEHFTPWSLRVCRDGTEDIAVIIEADGEELAYSRPFWLPEENDPVPPTLAAMRLMATAPRLLAALTDCIRILAAYDEHPGEEGDIYREGLAAICEATGRSA